MTPFREFIRRRAIDSAAAAWCSMLALAAHADAPPAAPPAALADRIGVPPPPPRDPSLSLDEAIGTIVRERTEALPPPAIPATRAVARYAAAYARLLDGEFDAARAEAFEAMRLAPDTVEPLELLARIETAAGRRLNAAKYHELALELDSKTPAAALALSADALSTGDYERALALVAPMMNETGAQPGWVRPIALCRAANALAGLGYLDAAIEAARGIDPPTIDSAPEAARPMLREVVRDQSALWERLGDTAVAIGEPARAAALFDEAEHASPIPRPLLDTHRVYALIEAGRVADAETLVIARVERLGAADAQSLGIIEYLLSRDASRSRLAGAIGAVASANENRNSNGSAALLRLAATIQSPDRGIAVLSKYLADHSTDEQATLQLLRLVAGTRGPADAWNSAVGLVANNPRRAERIADALFIAIPEQKALLEAAGDQASPAAAFLSGLVQLELGRERSALALLKSSATEPSLGGAAIAPAAELLLNIGRLDDAMALIESIDEIAEPAMVLGKAQALARFGMYERALEVLTPLLERPIDPAAEQLAGQLYMRLEQWEKAAASFNHARALDPLDQRSAEALMRLYAPGGQLASDTDAAMLAASVRADDPTSPVLGWLRAETQIAEGQPELAIQELRLLLSQYPDQQRYVMALVELLNASGRVEEAMSVLEGLVARRPGDSVARSLYANSLLAAGKDDEATDLQEDWLKRFPGDARASRQLEYILREKLSLRLQSEEQTEKRLANSPRTPEVILEDIDLRISRNRMQEVPDLLDEFRSIAPSPTPKMIAKLHGSAQEALVRAASSSAVAPDAIRVAREILGRYLGASSAELLRLELHTWSKTDAKAERLIERIDSAENSRLLAPGEATMIVINGLRTYDRLPGQRPIQNQRQRIDQAVVVQKLLRHAGTEGPSPTPEIRAEWFQACLAYSDSEELVRVLEYLDKNDGYFPMLDALAAAIKSRNGDDSDAAQVMTLAADVAAASDENRAAEIAFEGVLYFDPQDKWACNNLGYRLLERGESIARAVALIETAYRQAPGEAAIIDSMGWARYTQGRMKDETDPATGVVSPGAITLLEQSLEIASGNGAMRDSYNVLVAKDHLGDAVWAAGDHERARQLWSDAADLARTMLEQADMLEIAGTSAELAALIRRNTEKVSAADEGREPPVAPIHGGGSDPDTIPPPTHRNHGDSDIGRS